MEFPEWWADLFLYVIIATGAINCIQHFFKSLFLLGIYCYFRYWGGLEAVEVEEEEDEEEVENK